ncbi:Ferredoxin subunit of nitrite reductase or a ring-hydroxylating dioxygenase [Cupriavidus necator]|uniref:Nitrite reductase small subunit NirD n=1 Tax=Cupriavidus necator (strain ATCC 17699 / DSM 428 / KCTC 22496 / NCIMB 10442 / H16 / Stanier 337) TaxID=381666 RepID=Q0K354_CUPNH|nr:MULTISPECIES: nitrite reductase small subunit NirD [Cupriavidus]EON16598.1 nitrite reductase, NAD(P)H-dependent,ferredoxinsubunit [Cupriavidus sp. GA3-3]KUE85391.1 nitrite reductase small subunit [Cupriavidus necator]QCC03469.1 nitrite reductase small subunit NirD [Cupriavidus necator H16]QQB80525.1 nitrite reductase small subunit NirD [Cupriavidus necator]WKA44807.1 nitrite reductase small subunit NirD [Cupriavidus necator]
MSHPHHPETWTAVCTVRDIVPNTGVCALVDDKQVAVFRIGRGDEVYAIDNFDPNSQAAVLSRGLVGNLGERLVVASPIYKHHFDLRTGECLEAPEQSVSAYAARVYDGKVWIAAGVAVSEAEEELAA